MSTLAAALVAAWQSALAAEHQAYFGYDLLGPQLPTGNQGLAHTLQAAHATERDTTTAALAAAGHVPVAAAVDYPALYPIEGAAAAMRLAVRLEDACAAAWRYLYLQTATGTTAASAAAPPTLRATSQDALNASAVRATRWRLILDPTRATVAFPGL